MDFEIHEKICKIVATAIINHMAQDTDHNALFEEIINNIEKIKEG